MNKDKIEKRREREKRTISTMVAMYCEGVHKDRGKTRTGYCGDPLCDACAALDDYCIERTEGCRNMATKTNCEECPNHCYAPERREAIREAMRYAGPRMIHTHPAMAIRHLLKK